MIPLSSTDIWGHMHGAAASLLTKSLSRWYRTTLQWADENESSGYSPRTKNLLEDIDRVLKLIENDSSKSGWETSWVDEIEAIDETMNRLGIVQ